MNSYLEVTGVFSVKDMERSLLLVVLQSARGWRILLIIEDLQDDDQIDSGSILTRQKLKIEIVIITSTTTKQEEEVTNRFLPTVFLPLLH